MGDFLQRELQGLQGGHPVLLTQIIVDEADADDADQLVQMMLMLMLVMRTN